MEGYEINHVSKRKFELKKDDEVLGYLDYHEGVGSLYIDYVFVNPAYRGQKVGEIIVEEGIKIAKERNLKPKPICSYAATIMQRSGNMG